MIHQYTVTDIFNCYKQRAFETPMYGDATPFLTSYLTQLDVIDFEEDDTWPTISGTRIPVIKRNLFFKKGVICMDKILEKKKYEYWKWALYDFTSNQMFFTKVGVGEWTVETIVEYKYKVTYSYTARNIICAPLNWLFVKIQERGLMKIAMTGIKTQAESNDELSYTIKRNETYEMF
ncbi:MAG: hypothetical protein ACI9N1_001286 [Flavobacteriales bacterium]|jgi:hypothetical protein